MSRPAPTTRPGGWRVRSDASAARRRDGDAGLASRRAIAGDAHRRLPRLLLTACALAAALPTAVAAAPAAPDAPVAPVDEETRVGIQLLDAPVSAQDDPRANLYIIDHVPPGTSFERRILVSNSSAAAEHVELYPAAASIDDDRFTFAAGRTQNEMTTWISVAPTTVEVPALGSAIATVTVDVPADATSGEQYGLIWAEVAPTAATAATAQVNHVYRAGVRIYLDVGPGGAPPTDFRIASLTATRGEGGEPQVLAVVENTGGRTIDLSGSLALSDGPASQAAGPFAVDTGATVLAGQSADVVVRLDDALPRGPWRADVSLTSGLVHRTASATLTFPDRLITPAAPPPTDEGRSVGAWFMIVGLALALALLLLALVVLITRRRRHHRAALA